MKLISVDGKGNENLYRHPKTNIIYYRQYKSGKGRIERSTGTTNLNDARKIADRFRLELLGSTKAFFSRRLCGDLFPEFIKQKEILAFKTVQSIKLSWQHLKPFIKEMLPEEITPKWWEGVYIPEKRAMTKRSRKFFNDRKWLMMFLHSLKREGLLEKTPELINPDPERKAGKVYSDDEMQRLLANASGNLKLQILMASTMGMRKSEILGLAWERVDLKKRVIHLRAEDTKIRKARSFAISEPVLALLEQMDSSTSPYVFPSRVDANRASKDQINKNWQALKKSLNIKGRFHDLRHTFLTHAFKTTTNPALICFYAGLSLEEAQKTYLHFSVEDARCVADTGGIVGGKWLTC
jgi:integrase